MDQFQFKSPAAVVSFDGVDGGRKDSITIINLNVSPNAIWGTNGTAIVVEPSVDPTDQVVTIGEIPSATDGLDFV